MNICWREWHFINHSSIWNILVVSTLLPWSIKHSSKHLPTFYCLLSLIFLISALGKFPGQGWVGQSCVTRGPWVLKLCSVRSPFNSCSPHASPQPCSPQCLYLQPQAVESNLTRCSTYLQNDQALRFSELGLKKYIRSSCTKIPIATLLINLQFANGPNI